MKIEANCTNKECPFNPPPDFVDLGPYRHLVTAESVTDLPNISCPTCGEKTLAVLQVWDDGQVIALGKVVSTPGAMNVINKLEARLLLDRHRHGDWGDVDAADKRANNDAAKVRDGFPNGRVLSSYIMPPLEGLRDTPTKVWVITEAGRQSTTILLPEDY